MSQKSYSNLPTAEVMKSRLRRQLDEFATFQWRGIDMWEEYGCFIITEKNNLTIYNGASFSNDYAKPLYQSNSNTLMGVNFNTQTISFKVGVYLISEKKYRELIYKLDPYEISNLVFNFNTDYCYQVKLSSRPTDSVRYPQMWDKEEGENVQLFYTELDLKFEVQGEAVARAVVPYHWTYTSTTPSDYPNSKVYTYKIKTNDNSGFTSRSDLEFPLTINLLPKIGENSSDTTSVAAEDIYSINAKFKYGNINVSLFEISLIHWQTSSFTDPICSLTYDSESGVLLWDNGSKKELLTLITSNSSGENIVSSLNVYKFKVPGKFDESDINYANMSIEITVSTGTKEYNPSLDIQTSSGNSDTGATSIEAYAFTNLI